MTDVLPDALSLAPKLLGTFKVIDAYDFSELHELWPTLSREIAQYYEGQGQQATGLADSKTRILKSSIVAAFREVIKTQIVNSIPDLKFSDRTEDQELKEMRLQEDLKVLQHLFKRCYGVSLDIENSE